MFFILVLAALIAFAIFVHKQPDDFRVTRSANIAASPGTVFTLVDDFHKWESWSPWAKIDPNVVNKFEGADSGTGAIFNWSGNSKIGQGRMEITESRPNERILIRLEFMRPFKAVNTTEFTFQPQNKNTVVTWSMAGTNSFVAKFMNLAMNCEKMAGGQFEKGLATMKAIAEAST